MNETTLALIGGLILAAFIYLLYKKIKTSRDKKANRTGSSGGSGSGSGSGSRLK